MITFGPVPSRRLGQSLGINNIPPKVCTYACVYCQLGRTPAMRIDRREFHSPEALVGEVRDRARRVLEAGERIDYLSFVPEGEPTLDLNLGYELELLRPLGIRLAVISNGSLISRPEVRSELARADWVSLKVDAVREEVWHRIDRPHGKLRLKAILDGMLELSEGVEGRLVTETMLVEGVNDDLAHLRELAAFLVEMRPAVAYLAMVTRPPAEAWVHSPDERGLARAWHTLAEQLDRVEYLSGDEGDRFVSTGSVERDLLAITSVHPMRREAVGSLLERAGASWSLVERLEAEGGLVREQYRGQVFFLRGRSW